MRQQRWKEDVTETHQLLVPYYNLKGLRAVGMGAQENLQCRFYFAFIVLLNQQCICFSNVYGFKYFLTHKITKQKASFILIVCFERPA